MQSPLVGVDALGFAVQSRGMHDADEHDVPAGGPDPNPTDDQGAGNPKPPTSGTLSDRARAAAPSQAIQSAAWRMQEQAARLAKVEPHTSTELRGALVSPFGALELVLADQERVAKDILSAQDVARLISVLLGVSLLFSVPYGLVLGLDYSWRIAALFLGSLAVCLPSLQVFSNIIGIRIDIRRNLVWLLLLVFVTFRMARTLGLMA